MREILTKNAVCLFWQSMNYVFPIVGDSFCFFFCSKNFIVCLKKMTKSNGCVFCMAFFFSPLLGRKRPPISNTLASEMVENR